MPSRNSKLPKFVYRQVVKGRTYYRFRRTGGGAIRLPDDPSSAEFYTAYAALICEPSSKPGRYTPGSVAHTINEYYASAEFDQLAAGTRRDYRRYLDRLDRSVGDKAIGAIDNEYVFQIRDKLRDTPSAANHTVAVLRTLFKWAKDRKKVTLNPAADIGNLKCGDGYARWTEAEIDQFRAAAPAMMILALDIGLYTGQRLSDVIRLAWSNYDGERIRLRQQKTGTSMSIPVHKSLKEKLDAIPRTGLMILTTRTGLAFHPRVFSRDFRDARIGAGLPDGLSFHGLRHTAASRLAELGAGGPEIQAITGHKSLRMVEHYISQARQELQADRAIARLPIR